MGIDPRPDRRPAEWHRQQLRLGGPRPSERLLDLAGVAPELLAKADRGRVLEVRPAGLHHRPELALLGDEGCMQMLQGRDQGLLDRHRRRELQGRWDRVIGALAAIDVVVRMDRPSAQACAGEVGDHLVHVRVGRRTGPGLVDVDRELVVVLAGSDLCRGRRDRRRDLGVEEPERRVGLRGGELDQRQRADELPRHPLAGDREIENGTLRRGTVERVGGDLHLAHRIALDAGRAVHGIGHRLIVGPAARRHGHGALRSDSGIAPTLASMNPPTEIEPDVFRRVMGHFVTGVSVVTAFDDEQPFGITVNALSSVSLKPPLVMVALDRRRFLTPIVRAAGRYAVNILAEDQQALSDCFAGAPVMPGREAFCGAAWHPGATGLPLIDGAIATLECAVVETFSAGDHDLFIGRVEVLANENRHPMPLLYYRRRYLRIERAATAEVEGKPER